ncbi:uncharacterized protein [Nicotiana sylvestris]|uniref:uncharacterized protein n=1 Tax=Nicotiana sylvestris TaxID=4096 RepID=UPI00388CBBF4
MDVSTYNTKFYKLVIYAPYLVPTKEAQVQRFVDGLVGHIYTTVALQMNTLSYSDVVDLARKIENKGRDERVASDLLYRACQIRVEGRDTLDDLIVLDMIDFDMLMGMDWLSSCYVIVDCHAKIKGCLGILAIVNDTRKETVSIENIPVVREFSDVFPKDLPGLPPVREIDFGIDLLPDTQPISIPLYRMAPAELRELKQQLHDLLDKGFIRPSVSPWGVSVLFVKNKDGPLRMCIDYK